MQCGDMIRAAEEEMLCAWFLETGSMPMLVQQNGPDCVDVWCMTDYNPRHSFDTSDARLIERADRWRARAPLLASDSKIVYGLRGTTFELRVVPR